MITPRAAGGNVQFCGHEEITLESEKAEVPDNLHHICKGESAAGESFEVLEIRTAVGKKVQFFHDVPIGAVGLAPSCSIITCRRGSWTDMIPCWLSSDIGSEVRHLFPHTKLVLPHPLSKISTFILSTNLKEVAQTRIFLLHLQPINKNNTEKRH